MNLIGHHRIWERLKTDLAGGVLAHAILLVGPAHVGKSTLAKALIAESSSEDLFTAGDVYLFEDDGATLPIETLRNLMEKLSMMRLSQLRFVLIEDVSRLQAESLNMLLKTLEEPADGTIFVMTANRESDVMATLKSRCRVIRMSLVPLEELRKAGEEPWASMSFGRPGLMLRLQEDADFRHRWEAWHQRFTEFLKDPSRVKGIELGNLLEQEEQTVDLLDMLLNLARSWSHEHQQPEALLAVQRAMQDLDGNVNKKLVFDTLFLSFLS